MSIEQLEIIAGVGEFPADIAKLVCELQKIFGLVVFTGSRAIGHWRDDSDWDFVVSASELALDELPAKYALSCTASLNGVPLFSSLRSGEVNLIVDHSGEKDMLERWMVATDACVDRGCKTRDERIAVFREFGVN